MRRLVTIVAAVALVPVVAWTAASAGPEPPVDCVSPDHDCRARPASSRRRRPAVEPRRPRAADDRAGDRPTTAPPSTATHHRPGRSEHADDDRAGRPDATTTTAPVDPNATTTTAAVDPNATTTTVDPNATTTTRRPEHDDDDDGRSERRRRPRRPSPPRRRRRTSSRIRWSRRSRCRAGRIVIPAGAFDSGRLRAITFPVAGPISYVNDWGACRDGCARAHKGNDLIGDRRQPILAMHDGVDRPPDRPSHRRLRRRHPRRRGLGVPRVPPQQRHAGHRRRRRRRHVALPARHRRRGPCDGGPADRVDG